MKDLVTLTAEAFAIGGSLEKALEEHGRPYMLNPKQVQYADYIARALLGEEYKSALPTKEREAFGDDPVRGITTLLEGETGVGKTLGYLVPLCLHCALTQQRGLVSTYTLHLQHQIVQREFAVAAAVAKELTGVTLTVAPQKGKRNFVSVSRVRELESSLREEGQLDDSTKAALDSLAEHPSGDISEWLETNEFPLGIKSADICLLPGSDEKESALYTEHKLRAQEADVLVVTHTLLLISCKTWNTMFGNEVGGAPPFDVSIVDEADRLPLAAESVFSGRVSIPMLEKISASVDKFGFTDLSEVLGGWRKWMDEQFIELSTKYTTNFQREGAGGYIVLGDERTFHIKAQAKNIADQVRECLYVAAHKAKAHGMRSDDIEEFHTLANELSDFSIACDNMGSNWSAPVIRWSPVRTYGSFGVVPLWPGRLVTRLWRERKDKVPYLRSVVMTSATLDAPGENKSKFYGFREQIGVSKFFDHYNELGSASLSPEKFGKMDFVLADRRVPKPSKEGEDGDVSDEDWIRYVAQGIKEAQSRGGRSLVILPSYHDTESIAEEARKLGVNLIEHRRGERVADHLPAFTSPDNPNGVLITPAAWEGIDLPGMLRHVIIPRIPFSVIDNARNSAIMERILAGSKKRVEAKKKLDEGTKDKEMTVAQARGIIHALALANARRKLRQGAGRGIRSFTDKVTLWILDPRFPLPESITSNRRLRQVNLPTPMYMQFSACIPERFRSGIMGKYEDAEIFMAKDDAEQVAAE